MAAQTVDFILRPWHINDLDYLVRFANNKKIADNLTDAFPHPYTTEDGIAFINGALLGHHHPAGVCAIEVDGIPCGSIGIFPQTDVHRKNAEMGYWLAEEYWGKGIATAAVKQIIVFGFQTFDINRIFARPFSTNLDSQRVLEKAGMILEARLKQSIVKNGRYLDEFIYSILRSIPDAPTS